MIRAPFMQFLHSRDQFKRDPLQPLGNIFFHPRLWVFIHSSDFYFTEGVFFEHLHCLLLVNCGCEDIVKIELAWENVFQHVHRM